MASFINIFAPLYILFLVASVVISFQKKAMENETIASTTLPTRNRPVSQYSRNYPKNFWVSPNNFIKHPDECAQRVEAMRVKFQIPPDQISSLHHQCAIYYISNLTPLLPKRAGSNSRGLRALLLNSDGHGQVRVVAKDTTDCKPEWRPSSLDAFILKIVAEHFGSEQCFHVPGGRHGMIISLGMGVMDIYDSSVYYAPPDHSDYMSLYPHASSDLCVLVKRKERNAQNIFYSFTGDLWAALAATLLIYVGVLHVLGNPQPIMDTFRTFLVGSFDARQRPLANFLFVLLTAFGLIMVNAFLGVFMSFLATTREPIQLQTLEEVNRQVKRVYITPTLTTMLEEFDDDDVVKKLLKKYNPNWDGDAIQKDIRSSYDAAVILDAPLLEKLSRLSQNMDENGRPMFHIVRECILKNSANVYIVRRGWQLADRFSMKVQILKEAGFYEKAQSDDAFMEKVSGVYVPWVGAGAAATATVQSLSPRALVQPAAVLGVGVLLATAAFAGELLADRWRRRRRPRALAWSL